MDIEFNKDKSCSIAFYLVKQGTVFSYKGDYYIRIETIINRSFIDNMPLINCIRLSDGAVEYLNNNEQVMIVPAKLVIN